VGAAGREQGGGVGKKKKMEGRKGVVGGSRG